MKYRYAFITTAISQLVIQGKADLIVFGVLAVGDLIIHGSSTVSVTGMFRYKLITLLFVLNIFHQNV